MAARKRTPDTAARASAPLSIRIDPKTRYGLELLARAQRRSVTGVVEWCISEMFRQTTITEGVNEINFEWALQQLWSVNELDRLVALGLNYPSLLTYEEERMFAVLQKTPSLWGDKGRRSLILFGSWEELKPVVERAAARAEVVGLTSAELEEGGEIPL